MRLLMITRKLDLNDSLAGFTFGWVKKMSGVVSELTVICLEKGDLSGLPSNVKVYSLGKEVGASRFKRMVKFFWLSFKLTKNSQGIFCHMNPEYVLAVALSAKLYRKKIVMWYTHKKVSWRLRLAEKLANVVVTASRESFRLKSEKVKVLGHGIDVERFFPAGGNNQAKTEYQIISVGRLSPSKRLEVLIEAVSLLPSDVKNRIKVTIVGDSPIDSHQRYAENLRELADKYKLEKTVNFLGAVPNKDLPELLRGSDLFINLSTTGSLDKAVLEGMVSGCLVVTANEAFFDMLPKEMCLNELTAVNLADKIAWIIDLPAEKIGQWRQLLRQIVVKENNLDMLVREIIKLY